MKYKIIIQNDNEEVVCVEYKDLIFPLDSLNSQNIFGEIQLEFYKSLLLGKTVFEAEQDMIELENSYIKKYKELKYISLPLLWNKMNRKIIGNKTSSLTTNGN